MSKTPQRQKDETGENHPWEKNSLHMKNLTVLLIYYNRWNNQVVFYIFLVFLAFFFCSFGVNEMFAPASCFL